MSIKSDLRKEGIKVIEKLDTITVNSVAKKITEKLCEAFPEFEFNSSDLFAKLSRVNMYIANMPAGKAEANYFYKNNSIYFNENINFNNIDLYALHECIHYLQQIKDKSGNLVKLGLCEFTEFNTYGVALNEAAVQLITCKINKSEEEIVKYYDITFPTTSPNFYALQCNLVNQMAYITGKSVLYESTLFSNDNFKKVFSAYTNERTFYKIQKNLDIILHLEEKLLNASYSLSVGEGVYTEITNKINLYRNKIYNTFMDTQNLILTEYFDKFFSTIRTQDDISRFRNALYNYTNIIGSMDNNFYFSNYYIQKMADLDVLSNLLEKGQELNIKSNSLIIAKQDKISLFFRKMRLLLSKSKLLSKIFEN